jgi:hypothetical protein
MHPAIWVAVQDLLAKKVSIEDLSLLRWASIYGQMLELKWKAAVIQSNSAELVSRYGNLELPKQRYIPGQYIHCNFSVVGSIRGGRGPGKLFRISTTTKGSTWYLYFRHKRYSKWFGDLIEQIHTFSFVSGIRSPSV